MKSVTVYFGEDWDANDPSRVLRIVRDFMNLFDKSMAEIEVRGRGSQCRQTSSIMQGVKDDTRSLVGQGKFEMPGLAQYSLAWFLHALAWTCHVMLGKDARHA